MKKRSRQISLGLFFLLALLVGMFLVKGDYLSLDYIKTHRRGLLNFIQAHYLQAVIMFILLYLMTALFLPGALALTVAGGMLFGTVPAVVYVNIGATAGAILAFHAARSLLGGWVQEHFKDQLVRFNRELERHGPNYLLVLRVLPIIPFFVVNYCAGMTRIPLTTFVWTTSLGMLPGSFIYAFVGQQLRHVNQAKDLFSWKIMMALSLLAFFAILPVLYYHMTAGREGGKK
jgi:uncharacterized membrane protein YdjX (TVP38/TMEM64 family)